MDFLRRPELNIEHNIIPKLQIDVCPTCGRFHHRRRARRCPICSRPSKLEGASRGCERWYCAGCDVIFESDVASRRGRR